MKKNKPLIIGGIIIILLILILLLWLLTKKEVIATYEIKFDSTGGSLIQEQTVNEGDLVNKPEDPVKEGHLFIEWQHNNKTYDFGTKVNENITLVAVWQEVKETVEMLTVKFNSDGGTTIPNQIIEKGTKVIKPEDPQKEGYIFKGWYHNNESFNFDNQINENIEITAKWEEEPKKEETTKKYKITFDTNGGSAIATQTIDEGKKVTKPENPKKEGHTFIEWTLNGKTYDFNKKITKNITLVAKWKENEKNTYTITFDTNGGTEIATQTVTEGSKVAKPENPTKEGYTFIEWRLNGVSYNFDTKVTENITLVAEWKENKKDTYTVTFDTNGGTEIAPQTVTEGEKATRPEEPTRIGYTFNNWELNNEIYDFSNIVKENITLVAKWDLTRYKITYELNGGQMGLRQIEYDINNGGSYIDNPVRSGYSFVCWNITSGDEIIVIEKDLYITVEKDVNNTPRIYFEGKIWSAQEGWIDVKKEGKLGNLHLEANWR